MLDENVARRLEVSLRQSGRRRSLGAALLATVALAGVASAQESTAVVNNAVPTVVVGGEASISRAPDVAYLTLSIESRARTPRDAQRQNAEASAGVQQQIAAAGIPKDAVRTLGLWLEQEFDSNNGRRTPRGFVARNTLEVKIEDVARAGETADAVVQGGATSLSGIRFDLKDRAAIEREALRLAVADARRRADAAASGAGRSIDRILRIEDSRPDVVVPRMMMRAEGASAQTAVEPGLIEVRAHVALTASMK
ncbi:MAG: SIMPL domain-containing protein [Acidobacteriota bacterium]